tara:strand:- start:2814 stop:3083 length:270 start_codon:yes stop_codon:yes gene_type:complete
MINDNLIIKELLPDLELKNSFKTTPEYLNYISDSIDQVIAQAEHLLLTGHSKLTPIYKIKTIFTNKPLDLNDIKEIEQQANKIRVFTQN